MGSGAGEGLEKQERLEAKRLIQKLFKNSGVGVIGMKKRLYLGIIIWLSDSTPRYISKRNENIYPHKTCACMFIIVLCITAKKWKEPKCLPTEE